MGHAINEDGTLAYDHPATTPTRFYHVDGILAPFDKSTTLDGSRVVSATDETEAAEKVLTACRRARGGDWGWVGQVKVYPHYAQHDPDCPVCKRRNHKEYPKAIDALYEPTVITPTRLTDSAEEYAAPSEAAMRFISDLEAFAATPECEALDGEAAKLKFAQMLDAFTAQAVAAERTRYDALKAVADSMAKAVRSAKADAVYDSGYEHEGSEYTAYAIDSDYVHALYKALADYERATDPAPKLSV